MYAVIAYTDTDCDNYVEIKHVVSDSDIAQKLAFHYAKKSLPEDSLYRITDCKIIQDYSDGEEHMYMENEFIVDYRIAELTYNDEEVMDGRDGYTIHYVYKQVWAVVKLTNQDIPDVEVINRELIYEI